MKRIKRFGVYQTSKVFAIIYFLVSAIFLIPIGLIFSMMGDTFPGLMFNPGKVFYWLPVFYGIFGFITTAIGCLVYNLIARWTGGIELQVETTDLNVPSLS